MSQSFLDVVDQGFRLFYEDYDRNGTAGVSAPLKAKDFEDAAQEARTFLESRTLPEQNNVWITRSYVVDVSDIKFGRPKA